MRRVEAGGAMLVVWVRGSLPKSEEDGAAEEEKQYILNIIPINHFIIILISNKLQYKSCLNLCALPQTPLIK